MPAVHVSPSEDQWACEVDGARYTGEKTPTAPPPSHPALAPRGLPNGAAVFGMFVHPLPVESPAATGPDPTSGRRDLASTAAVVREASPPEGGILEPRMMSLQPLLELDRHKHAHLARLVDPQLRNVFGL